MPSKLSFLAAFGVAEANRALSAFTTMLVKFDPKTAGEAEIRVMSQEVEKVARFKVEAAEELGPAEDPSRSAWWQPRPGAHGAAAPQGSGRQCSERSCEGRNCR